MRDISTQHDLRNANPLGILHKTGAFKLAERLTAMPFCAVSDAAIHNSRPVQAPLFGDDS